MSDNPVVLTPDLGSGPTTGDAPEPADPPGPKPDPEESTESSAKLAAFTTASFSDALPSDRRVRRRARWRHRRRHRRRTVARRHVDGTGRHRHGTGTGTGDVVDLGGIGFTVPDGWEVEFSEDGFAQLWGPGGYFIAYTDAPPVDIETLIANHLNGLARLRRPGARVHRARVHRAADVLGGRRRRPCCTAA